MQKVIEDKSILHMEEIPLTVLQSAQQPHCSFIIKRTIESENDFEDIIFE